MSTKKDAFTASDNQILAALPAADLETLRPKLEWVTLHIRDAVYEPDQPIEYVYFPVQGVISLVKVMADGTSIETATVGKEGCVGLPVFLGTDRTAFKAFCQIPGAAFRLPATRFREEVGQGGALHSLLLRYTLAVLTQIAQSAACNRLHSMEQRCARWLLLCHDRMRSDEFLLTHEFLSEMLGVRRASVTVAAGHLQDAGLIRYNRGRVAIVDRPGLETAACECYQIIQTEFERLIGSH